MGGMTRPPASGGEPGELHFKRAVGLLPAIAINMTQMCGVGPFVTIPLIVGAMGGPQAIFAFVLGAIIAMADGLVWAELGASMPGAGGTYLYLREAFQYRTGRLMPFLFIWTAMISIPLIMSTGVIGLVQYIGYYYPSINKPDPVAGAPASWWDYVGVTPWGAVISLVVVVLVVVVLYRNISAIEKLTTLFFVIMLTSVGAVALASFTHFHFSYLYPFPQGAFNWPWGGPGQWFGSAATAPATVAAAPPSTGPVSGIFFLGLGFGLINAVYDYGGYNTTVYMGAELKNPGRVIPRSVIISILGMMVVYLTLQVGVLGAVPWQDIAASKSIGSLVMERTWNKTAAQILTGLIVITAFASVVMGLLGGSRVPYNAAKDRLFLPIFGRMHPRLNFPHVSLLVMAVIMAVGSLFSLGDVLTLLTAVMILVQCISQIAALTVLRKRQPELRRPYKMFLYPLPSIIALGGWLFLLESAGLKMLGFAVAWVGLGVVAFLIWAKVEKTWPFGPKEIREEFLEAQRTLGDASEAVE